MMLISFFLHSQFICPVLSGPFKTDICLGPENFYDGMYLTFVALATYSVNYS